ncbi:MAG: hypothetical protein KDD77_07805 [Caldilineaceae bacterium]|nr:hypothetical protein [Caldilineaceae bacterium]
MSTTNGSKQGPPISFRDRDIEVLIQQRTEPGFSRGNVASRDLARYYALLDAELPALSDAEQMALHDALNSTRLDAQSARMLWAIMDDAIRLDGLADKWEIDGWGLVNRLREMTPAQCLALVDASERYWAAVSQED